MVGYPWYWACLVSTSVSGPKVSLSLGRRGGRVPCFSPSIGGIACSFVGEHSLYAVVSSPVVTCSPSGELRRFLFVLAIVRCGPGPFGWSRLRVLRSGVMAMSPFSSSLDDVISFDIRGPCRLVVATLVSVPVSSPSAGLVIDASVSVVGRTSWWV